MRRTWLILLVTAAAGLAACGSGGEGGGDASDAPAVARAIPSSICSPMTSAGEGRGRFLIPVVGPLQHAYSDHGIQNQQAAKLVLAQREWRAGGHAVALQVCDEATADKYTDLDKCERIARAAAANPSVLVVVGPSVSSCAARMIPILNGASGGPVALVGLGNTYVGLTRDGPGVEKGDPARLYPTGRRSYLRTAPADDIQAAAAVVLAQEEGVRRTFAVHDGSTYGRGTAASFQESARRAGLTPVGTDTWDPEASGYRGLAERVARARPDAVYLGGGAEHNGPRLIRDLRGVLGRGVMLLGPDGLNQPTAIVEGAGERAEGMTITLSAVANRALPPRGRAWAAAFTKRWGSRPCCYAVHAGQAMELVLDAIAGGSGDRAGVLDALRGAQVRDGLVGDFSFDALGDSTLRGVSLWRIEGGRLRYLRMVEVPDALLSRE